MMTNIPDDLIIDPTFYYVAQGKIKDGVSVLKGELLKLDSTTMEFDVAADTDAPDGVALADGDGMVACGMAGAYNVNGVFYYKEDSFSGDGTTTTFTLTKPAHDIISVSVGGIATDDYTFDADNGTVTFSAAPASGTNNVVVVYKEALTPAEIYAARAKMFFFDDVEIM